MCGQDKGLARNLVVCRVLLQVADANLSVFLCVCVYVVFPDHAEECLERYKS